MAVLGIGGRLYLKREAPDACVISSSAVTNDNSLLTNCPGYWTGDKVTTSCLPTGGGNFPPNPDGYGMYYSSKYFQGPNRTQVNGLDDDFYKSSSEEYPTGEAGDDSQFYSRVGDVSNSETLVDCGDGAYFIHLDELGAISFYNSRAHALEGSPDDRVSLFDNLFGVIGLAPFGSANYNNAFWRCVTGIEDYSFGDVQDISSLASICDDAPDYEAPAFDSDEYENANVSPRSTLAGQTAPYWQLICEVANWSLELSAPSVDTTSLSEKFGEAVKSLVTGGGSAEFLIDRESYAEDHDSGTTLMKLLLMTERGCKASARFYLVNRGGGVQGSGNQIPGDLYYSSELLVTNSAVNVRPADIIAGTANFVTTGEIKLLEATDTVIL